MFTSRQILDFCNSRISYFSDKYINAEGDIDPAQLAEDFIFQHAMEDTTTVDQVVPAINIWWGESDFNSKNIKFKS